MPNARSNKNDRLPYFEYQKAARETTEEDNEETVFAREKNYKIEKDYVSVLFFIDENAQIQVVHTQKMFKSMKE